MLSGFQLNSNRTAVGKSSSVLWPWLLPLKQKKVPLTLPAAAANNCPVKEKHPSSSYDVCLPADANTSHGQSASARFFSNERTTYSVTGLFDFLAWSKATLPILPKTKKFLTVITFTLSLTSGNLLFLKTNKRELKRSLSSRRDDII